MWPTLATAALAWIHVFAAIGWMGAIMAFGMVIGPGLTRMSPPARLEFFAKVAPRFLRYGISFAGVTLVFGAALAYGEYDFLFSPMRIEGIYVMVGALLALANFFLSVLSVEPTVHKITAICESLLQSPGPPPPQFEPLQRRFRTLASAGIVLLILVLVFMIAAAWT